MAAVVRSDVLAPVLVDQGPLTIAQVIDVCQRGARVELHDEAALRQSLAASCERIAEAVEANRTVYGVNTGFGGMSGVQIEKADTPELQRNLLWFLKAGAGRSLPVADVRGAMLLRIRSFLHGVSGVRWELVERLQRFLNEGVTPVVREFGSIGASGDLIPLANIAGSLIGLGDGWLVDDRGTVCESRVALRRLNLEPLPLQAKEGLALVNGTSMSTAIAARCLFETQGLLRVALATHALMIQALSGMVESFGEFIHRQKPHPGQIWTAARMRELLAESQLVGQTRSGQLQQVPFEERILKVLPSNREAMSGFAEVVRQIRSRATNGRVREEDIQEADLRSLGQLISAVLKDPPSRYYDVEPIQDRYSIRCLPQFLGPIVEGLQTIERQIEIEMNSANDNPLIDADNHEIYHCGNFLAQYTAVAMDQLRHYVGLIAKHLDAQIALLVTPEFSFGLPPSLVGNPRRRVNMGLKGLQIAGNSIMPLLSYFSQPLTNHFPTHAEQFNQNINSQGFGSACLARQAVDAFRQYMAIALIFGVQAVDLRMQGRCDGGTFEPSDQLSPGTRGLYHAVRHVLGKPADGRPLIVDDDQQSLEQWIERLASDLSAMQDGAIGSSLNAIAGGSALGS